MDPDQDFGAVVEETAEVGIVAAGFLNDFHDDQNTSSSLTQSYESCGFEFPLKGEYEAPKNLFLDYSPSYVSEASSSPTGMPMYAEEKEKANKLSINKGPKTKTSNRSRVNETIRRKRFRDKLELLKNLVTRSKKPRHLWYWTHADILQEAKNYIEELKTKIIQEKKKI